MRGRVFTLGAILTVTTGKFVAPGGIGDIYLLLNHMTGDSLMTHQLPRASEECAPHILDQHPDLKAVEVPEEFDDEAHVWRWLAEQVDRFGAERELTPLAAEDHTRIDPLVELRMMKPDAEIITVELPRGGDSDA